MSKFEETTGQTGWGLFNQFVVGMAAACTFSQAVAFMSIPFAIPIAACDLALDDSITLSVIFSLYLGMAVGGLILNSIADTIGNKYIIPLSLIFMFCSNFSCGFSHGYGMLVVCVFFLGAGLSTNASCVKIHVGETLPIEKRGFYLIVPDLFWSLGYIMSTLLSWLVTPTIIHIHTTDIRLATWRLMFGLASAPSMLVACASALLHSSPRFLLYNKQYTMALESLKQIYTINNNRHYETFQLSENQIVDLIDDYGIITEPLPQNCTDQTLIIFQRLKRTTGVLLNKKFFLLTIMISILKLPTVFGLAIPNMWLSKMLHYGENKECFLTGYDILHVEAIHVDNVCKMPLDADAYKDFFLLSLSAVVGQIILLCIVEKLGRRIPIICGCLICGLASITLAYIENWYNMRLILSFGLLTSYSVVQSAMSVILVELYPTAVRGTAAGETQFFAYIFCAAVYKYLQTPCQYLFIVFGSFILAAIAPAFFLPDVTGKPMVE